MPSGPDWWHRTWYCPFCKTTIKRHHRARHQMGKRHLQLMTEFQGDYEWKASDTEFAIFLYKFDARELRGYEKRLYEEVAQ